MVSKRDCALITVLFMAEFSRGAFFLTFLPLVATGIYGWSVATAGLAASVHFFTENMVKTCAGYLLDRMGRPVLLGGLGLALVSLIMAGIYPHPVLLLVFSGLFGLGLSPLWLGVITGVAPAGIKDRSSRISLVFAAWLAGMGSGLSAIGFVIARSYQLALWVIVFIFMSATIGAWLFYRPAPVARAADGPGPSPLRAARRITGSRTFFRLLLPGMFFQTLSAGLLIPVLPVFATAGLGLSPERYSLLVIAGGLVMVLLLMPMGRLADKSNLFTILFSGLALSAGALSGLALAGNKDNALIIALILGISYAAVLPAWNSLLAGSVPPEQQATGWGILSTIEGLGMAAGPAIGGLVARSFSPAGTMLMSSAILGLMAVFYLVCQFLYKPE